MPDLAALDPAVTDLPAPPPQVLPVTEGLIITASPGGSDHDGLLCVRVTDVAGNEIAHAHLDADQVKAFATVLPSETGAAFGEIIEASATAWHHAARAAAKDAGHQADHAQAIRTAAHNLTANT